MESITEFFMKIVREHVRDEFLLYVALTLLQTPLVQANACMLFYLWHDPLVSSEVESIKAILSVVESLYFRHESDTSLSKGCYQLGKLCKHSVDAGFKELAQNMVHRNMPGNSPFKFCPFEKNDAGEFIVPDTPSPEEQTHREVHGQEGENSNRTDEYLYDMDVLLEDGQEISRKQQNMPKMTYKVVDNDWEIKEVGVWIWPLKRKILNRYKAFKPLENIIGNFWSGVCDTQMGPLLPPVHPFLVWRMHRRENGYYWMGYDCGNKGVGIEMEEEVNPGQCPAAELFRKHSGKAVKVYTHIFQDEDRPPQLYELLEYAYSHSTPISLKVHLELYPDDPVKAVTQYCNTTCWGFVDGALSLFCEYCLQLDPKLPEIAELLATEASVPAQPANI